MISYSRSFQGPRYDGRKHVLSEFANDFLRKSYRKLMPWFPVFKAEVILGPALKASSDIRMLCQERHCISGSMEACIMFGVL